MVRPFPELRRIPVGSFRRVLDSQPIWSRDGRELFYRTEDGSVMSVPIRRHSYAALPDHGPPVRVVTPVNTLRDWAIGPGL